MAFIEPLNLSAWLIDAFAGSMEIFMFIALVSIAGMAAYFRMLSATMLIMFGIFGMIMAHYFSGIYFFVVLIGGLATAYGLSRIIKN